MGDRVLVTFTSDDKVFTPAIYMHWNGHKAADMIKAASSRMRRGDANYSAARFCGECHKAIEGELGLGILNVPDDVDWNDFSHGDAGVYVVNVISGCVKAYGGYGKTFKLAPAKFAQR